MERGDSSSLALSGALRFQVTPDFAVTLANDHGYQKPQNYFGTPLIDGRLDRSLRYRNYNVSDSDIRYRDNWTQLKAEWQPNASLSLRNTAYRLTSDRHWRNVESYAWEPQSRTIRRTSYIEIEHEQEQVGNRFDATLHHQPFGLRNELAVGFDLNRIDFTHINNAPYGGTSFVDPYAPSPGLFINMAGTSPRMRSWTRQYALFAEDRLTLSDRFALVGGLRYDAPTVKREELVTGSSFKKDFHALSWRAGIVYTPVPDLAFYGQYATAVDPVGSLISLSPAQKDFDLSRGRQIEVGVKQSFWEGRGEWTLAAYHIVKDKLLTTDPNRPGVTLQVGQQSSRGLEASVAFDLWDGWRIDANGALLRARYDDFTQTVSGRSVSYTGKVPVDVPERTANVWLSWAFAPDWQAQAGLHHVGRTYGDAANLIERPAYTLVNAGLDFKPTETTRLSLRFYNLFDELYAVAGNRESWVVGRPRSAELSFSMSF
jgi:iron complex outermembrane receptor protein